MAADGERGMSRRECRPISATASSGPSNPSAKIGWDPTSGTYRPAAVSDSRQSQGHSHHASSASLRDGRRKRKRAVEESDTSSGDESDRAVKRRRPASRERRTTSRRRSKRLSGVPKQACRETASSNPSLNSAPHAGFEDRLRTFLRSQDDKLPPAQVAILMMRTCLSIMKALPASDVPATGPLGLTSPAASLTRPRYGGGETDPVEEEDATGAEFDEIESDDGFCGDKRPRRNGRQKGRRRWSELEEKRLQAYMKEAKGVAWAAEKLGRSKSAVMQHWDIMYKREGRE